VIKGSGGTKTVLSLASTSTPCTPGAATGTVKFVAPASYSAGYTIGSIDNGVTEAIYHAYFNAAGQPGGYGNADILIPAGRYFIYGTTKYHIAGSSQSITIRGAGTGVTLLARDVSFTSGNQFQLGTPGGVAGAKYILRDLTSESPQSLQVTSGAHVAIYPNHINAELRNLDLLNGYDGVGVYSSSAMIRNVRYVQEWQHACPTGEAPCTGGHSARYGLDLTKDGVSGGPVSGVHVSDSSFTSSYPWHATYSLRAGVHITGSAGIEIFDSWLGGWAGAHLITDSVNAIQDVWFDNVMIDDMGQSGIYMEGANPSGTFNSNIMISGSHIRAQGGGAETVQNGISNLMSGSNFRISDTEVSGFLNGYCMQFLGGSSATVNGLQLIGNDLTNCDVGMQVPGANYTNVIINGNRVGRNLTYPVTMSVGLDLPSGSTSMAIGLNDFSLATAPVYYTAGGQTFTDFVMGQNIGVDTVVPIIASAASIAAPLNPVVTITGATPIDTITHGSIGRKLSLIFTDNAPTGLTAAGNIAVSVTVKKDDRVDCTYAGTKWYCAGGGGVNGLIAQYIPYAAANGLLDDTTIWWDSANLRSVLRHTTDLGGQYIEGYGASGTIPGFQVLRAARGTPSSYTALLSGDYLGTLAFGGYGATTWGGATVASAAIQGRATEAFSDTAKGTELLFWTTPKASVTPKVRLTITDAGKFGLGVSPGANTIFEAATSDTDFFYFTKANATANASIIIRSARGTIGSPTAIQSGDYLGGLVIGGYGATSYGNIASITARAAETFTDSVKGTELGFYTTAIGAASRTERMRLGNDGILSLLYGADLSNDKYIRWKDSAGTAISTLGLDGSNNFHVGLQAAPASAGDTFFYARGVDAFKLIKAVGGPFTLEPISDPGATAYLSIGTATKRIGPFHGTQNTLYTIGAAPAFLALQTAAGGSFVNLYAGTATGANYNLLFPSAAPGAANKVMMTTTGTDNPLIWGNPALLDAAQTFTATQTFSSGLKGSGYTRVVSSDINAKAVAEFNDTDANNAVLFDTGSATYDRGFLIGYHGYDFKIVRFDPAGVNVPIYDFTIANDGTITTLTDLIVGGTVTASGHILPGAGSSYSLGAVGNTFLGSYVDNLFVYTGITAPNAAAGLSASVSCGAGTAVKTMTVSGGLITAVGCAAP
jgi:hypothetical protein